jgi:LPPG:FO 2-phospho-L-lactate transferase
MPTFLAGGTGTPKLLAGADDVFPPAETAVVCNTGDDVELGGHLVCPDLDTVLFLESDRLDRESWWGIEGDTAETHDELAALAAAADLAGGPRYLADDAQTAGPAIADWRRFSAVAEFMHIGDRDRAIHLTRSGLLAEGHTLTEVTAVLREALGVERTVVPMSDDPVATLIHTPDGVMHFQEYWVGREGEPTVTDVEFRGAAAASPTEPVLEALSDPVVIGPSNPVTSIGPMVAMDDVREALAATPVVAVSPFIEDRVFSGPAAALLTGVGREASTAGVAAAYPFADAFVLDAADDTSLERPVVRTDTTLDDEADAARVAAACAEALDRVG